MEQQNVTPIYFVSLGCDKNLVDSEMMITSLREQGFRLVNEETEAEVIVVNTCCFIGDAKEESINTLLEMASYKETAKCKLLVAAGCLAQRYHKEIQTEIPEVDIIVGTMGYENLAETIRGELKEHQGVVETLQNIDYLPTPLTNRDSMSGGYYAYLKIAEGCDKHCTYCIIPKVRGNYRSVKMEYLIDEAKKLAEQGVKELILVAQETTMYGKDIYGKKSLHILLKELAKISGIYWIRILYCYPEEIYDELIDVIASEKKICNYLDLPIQHASDTILKKMGRRTTNKDLRDIIGKLRKRIPDIVLRTTLITGFPGETEEDHQINLDFVNEMEFERLGVFTYSAEENTPAANMPNQIDEEVKEDRRNDIMELQQDIVFDNSEKHIGKTYIAMIEGRISGENAYMGRTYMDVPGIDSNIFIITDEELMTGDFVKVKVTGINDYDLIGQLDE